MKTQPAKSKLTKEQQRRRAVINTQLVNLSRNGWRDARSCDYLPLEAELRELRKLETGK